MQSLLSFIVDIIELWEKLRHRELGGKVLFTERHWNRNSQTFNPATGLLARE